MITISQEGIAQDFSGLAGGICSACDHLSTCRLHKVEGMPVFFCEEFECASEPPQTERVEVYALPGSYADEFSVSKPENARFSYAGLCRSCMHLTTCMHLKPGGGTWACATYEELKA